jgi:CRP-like cAMP-binding protein
MNSAEQDGWSVLEQSRPPKIYEKGKMIYWQGSHADQFYYLKSGGVRVFLCSENGSEKTLSVMKPGRVFGEAAFFDGLPRVSSAKALRRSEVVPVTHRSLVECIRREPQLAVSLLTYLSQTIRMLSAQLDTVAFQQADERIARLLLNLAAEGGAVRATHEDLAALAGVSRVTVSRILADFSRRGWVETRYREIRVADAGALRRFLPLDDAAAKKGTRPVLP